ncbi:MAG: type II toxin-antitoxin system VapC family toxin [Nanoarchaeota archaeon]|nr:type II toxin-antitoxin system VapC family toxin [Nanoarchaeota archaeon]
MNEYIDSNIFVHALIQKDARSVKSRGFIKMIINKKISAVTSLLTWDEIVHVIRKFYGQEHSIDEGRKFLSIPNLVFLDVNKKTISYAQELVKKYGLKPRDAIHAATAILNGCDSMISDDSDFDKVKEIKRVKV